MSFRFSIRKKEGKTHRSWSIVENRRISGGRVLQRHVLYLGEINDSQELAWRRSIAVLEEGAEQPRTLSLFPEDRCEGLLPDTSIVRLKLTALQLRRPRQWGARWLVQRLWRELELDGFWGERLPPTRKGAPAAGGFSGIAGGTGWGPPSPGWHPGRACRWPTRCCLAIPRTSRRCAAFSRASSGNMARRGASG